MAMAKETNIIVKWPSDLWEDLRNFDSWALSKKVADPSGSVSACITLYQVVSKQLIKTLLSHIISQGLL